MIERNYVFCKPCVCFELLPKSAERLLDQLGEQSGLVEGAFVRISEAQSLLSEIKSASIPDDWKSKLAHVRSRIWWFPSRRI